MNDAVTVALIAAVPGTLGSIVSLWVAVQQAKIVAAQKVADATMLKLEKNTNSIKDELIRSTAKASHAEGVADEKERAANDPQIAG